MNNILKPVEISSTNLGMDRRIHAFSPVESPFTLLAILCRLRSLLIFSVFCWVPLDGAIAEEMPESDSAKLIRQLGDDDFYVRQRAEETLLKLGGSVYEAVEAARESSDLEVAERAKRIFSQLDADSVQQTGFVRNAIDTLQNEPDPAIKIWHLQSLGCSSPLSEAEGLPVLCRYLKFSSNKELRAESARIILTMPPLSPTLRDRWFQAVDRVVGTPQNDLILRLVDDYIDVERAAAVFRPVTDAELAYLRTVSAVNAFNGKSIPPSIAPPVSQNDADRESLRQALAKYVKTFHEFCAVPEYSQTLPNGMTQILMLYKLAELQSLAGLEGDAQQSLVMALAIRAEKPTSGNPHLIANLYGMSEWAFHLEAGSILATHGRLDWAEREFQLVRDQLRENRTRFLAAKEKENSNAGDGTEGKSAENAPKTEKNEHGEEPANPAMFWVKDGEVFDLNAPMEDRFLIPFVLSRYADIQAERCRFSEAAALLDEAIPLANAMGRAGIVPSDNGNNLTAYTEFFKAKAAANAGNWKEAREHILEALNRDSKEVDFLILRYKLKEHLQEIPEAFVRQTDQLVKESLQQITQGMGSRLQEDLEAASAMNEFAWLAVNTGQELPAASYAIDTALARNPENWAHLDTLVHLLATAGDLENAVRVQEIVVRCNPQRTVLVEVLEQFQKQWDEKKKKEGKRAE